MIQMIVSSPYRSKMITTFNTSRRRWQTIRVKSVSRSKRLHIIPEEAQEDKDEEPKPGNSEEDSDEFSDDVKNVFLSTCRKKNILNSFFLFTFSGKRR